MSRLLPLRDSDSRYADLCNLWVGLMQHDWSELLAIAKHAARLARDVHRHALEAGDITVDFKTSHSDLVTHVDRESERVLVQAIRAARPDDEIVGEEGT